MSYRLRKVLLACLVLGAVSTIVSCGKFSADTYWRSGKYILIAVDTPGQMSLTVDESSMSSALVGPTVFSVGADDRHIVVKQHPSTDSSGRFDRSITNYFIVDRTANTSPSEKQAAVLGPLNEAEFTNLTRTQSLPPFTKTFKDLE
jgi:hypothetical protein